MGKRLKRFAFFLLAILVGAALGLFVGWEIAPVRNLSSSPHTLRRDYQADYVLMVAEIYHHEGNLPMAMARLAALGEDLPGGTTLNAIAYAQEAGYDPADLALMLALSVDLQQSQPEGR